MAIVQKKRFPVGQIVNYALLTLLAFICLYPFLNVI